MTSILTPVPAPLACYFPGYTPEQVQLEYPICPLDDPDMPAPGPNFLEMATTYGDKPPLPIWRKPLLLEYVRERTPADAVEGLKALSKDQLFDLAQRLFLPGSWLETMYRAAVYKPHFTLQVIADQQPTTVRFLPGHLWGARRHDMCDRGPYKSPVMVVAKHPGRDDMNQMFNFCGDASQDLLKALDELGVTIEDRGNWYITNVIKHMNVSQDKEKVPADWLKNCLPVFHQELRLVMPEYILCLGADAAKVVLGRHVKMADTVGQIYDHQFSFRTHDGVDKVHTFKVVCCAHPGRIAREPELYDKPDFLGSLRLFVDLVRGTRVGNAETNLERRYIFKSSELTKLVDEVLAETKTGATIAIDGEWHGAFPWDKGAYLRTIQFSHKAKFGASVILTHPGGIPNHEMGPSYLDDLRRLLTSTPARPVRLVGHNLKADLPWIKHAGLDLQLEFEAPKDLNGVFGWQRTATEGGFDTLLAAHAHNETGPFKLEVLCAQLLGTPRYDTPLLKWRKEYCSAHDMKEDDLEGYGDVPEDILLPYGAYDADVTRRLFDVYNGLPDIPGLLDCDRHTNSCREAFWVSQRATMIAMEIETRGLLVDREGTEKQIAAFSAAKSRLITELKDRLDWPDFNPESTYHRREFLFGERYAKRDKDGKPVRLRPAQARSLELTPITNTDGKAWHDGMINTSNASTDKMTIGILSASNDDVRLYRDLRYIGQTLKTVLRPAAAPIDPADDGEEPIYEKGLLSFVGADNRVRTRIFPVETGRWSSSKPNLMNYSSRRDEDYRRILKEQYRSLRSLFIAPPGHVLIEADYTGAELAATGWLCNDQNLIEHCSRMVLPESHPDFYDIHSSVAVNAFGLSCPPTKGGLKKAGFAHLRIAAKRRIFGLFYGQSDEAALLQIHEEGAASVTLDDVRRTTAGIHEMYAGLDPFFQTCRRRVSAPGWICNPFGRFRRFRATRDRQRQGELERQAMNFPIQSSVADSMSRALDNLYCWRQEHLDKWFDILLQIHDAVLLCVPAPHVELILDEVLPDCMSKRVAIWPCDLDGMPFKAKPNHLGIDTKMGIRWGEALTKAQAKDLGIPDKYGKA